MGLSPWMFMGLSPWMFMGLSPWENMGLSPWENMGLSLGERGLGKRMKESARRPVSRVLSPPSKGRGMAIHLGRPLPDASRDRPGRRLGNLPADPFRCRIGSTRRPYLVLLPVGFTVPFPLPGTRCALTAPFHPCLPTPRRGPAVCFLWHFPWGRPRRVLPGTVSPWSPDFPPPPRRRGEGSHPAVWRRQR